MFEYKETQIEEIKEIIYDIRGTILASLRSASPRVDMGMYQFENLKMYQFV